MAHSYSHLTTDQRKQILDQQILQFEQELFGHEMNKARLNALSEDDVQAQKAVEQANKAIETIENAIAVTIEQREALGE
jgi:hypothetical protein